MSVAAYETAKKEIKRLREEQTARAQEAFTEASKELFDRFPALQSFGWRQYTPYFNDGDECVFGVRNDEYSIRINDFDPDEDHDEKELKAIEVFTEAELKAVRKAVSKFLNVFEDEDMKAIFGDHVEVTVTRKGQTEVDEYSHD